MKLIKTRAFQIGFILGLVACALLNFYSYLQNVCSPKWAHCGWSFGFPVHLYIDMGFISVQEIVWPGLIIDIGFAVTTGVLVGLVLRFIEVKIRRPLP